MKGFKSRLVRPSIAAWNEIKLGFEMIMTLPGEELPYI